MNPELLRNCWIELTPRRLVLAPAALGFAFFTAYQVDASLTAAAAFADTAFYIIVVLWGSWKAAQSVVTEIRDRTWDQQRLSSIGPWTMVLGKLFGATAFVWYAGAFCLGLLVYAAYQTHGLESALYEAGQRVTMGLAGHVVAFFASLIAARRRQTGASRLEVFLYTLAGLFAAYVAQNLWSYIRPDSWWAWLRESERMTIELETVMWWGQSISIELFLLASLGLYIGWALYGSQRLMRLELMMSNWPFAWIGFLVFVGVYWTGFSDFAWATGGVSLSGAQWASAASVYLALTYAAALAEPKDIVHYRWIVSRLAHGRLDQAFLAMPAWFSAFVALSLASVGLLLNLNPEAFNRYMAVANVTMDEAARNAVLAQLGFVARDMAIFLFWNFLPGQRRGDLAALISLVLLWLVVPAFISGSGGDAYWLVLPQPTTPPWVGPLVAWAQAATVWGVVISQMRLPAQSRLASA